MGNFRYKMAQFMIGRNGFDNFCQGLSKLALLICSYPDEYLVS